MTAPSLAAPRAKRFARLGSRLTRRQPAAISIRWRLTIWYTVVLALTLAIFSLVVYWWLGRSLMGDIDSRSYERALQVEERIERAVAQDQLMLTGVLDPAQYEVLQARGVLVGDTFDPFSTPGVGVRVWNHRAKVIDASEELHGTQRMLDYQPIVFALQGQVHRYILEAQEGSFYSYSYPVLFTRVSEGDPNGRPRAVVQILTSLQSYEAAMSRLAQLLIMGTLFVTAIAFVTGAALAQTALQSINTITRTAQQINRARDLDRRIPLLGPRDEIHSLTETINEMLDRIEAMFDRQRQFMADVSHELRTPLTTIRGEVELMQRSGSVDPEGLDAVCGESERMSRLVGDLLLLARADRDLEIEREPVALEELLVDVYRQAQRLAKDERTIVMDNVDACLVIGDRDRLKQVVLNLVQNALLHTPPGTSVRLALRRDKDSALITVSDDGPGIPPEELENIFERFYRVDKARSRKAGGTGLGLSIVDWVTTAHDGTVTVESEPAGGTTFVVSLPLANGKDRSMIDEEPSAGGQAADDAVAAGVEDGMTAGVEDGRVAQRDDSDDEV